MLQFKTIIFKIIKFTKRLFIIKRLIGVAFLLFLLYDFSGKINYVVSTKESASFKASEILNKKQLDKYTLLTDYKINCEHAFQVNKLFKKDKVSHFYVPLVDPQKPTEVIALIEDRSTTDINAITSELYCAELNKPEAYFEQDIESKLLNGEIEYYENLGYTFPEKVHQLEIGSPPKSYQGYLIAVIIASLILVLILLSLLPMKVLNKMVWPIYWD